METVLKKNVSKRREEDSQKQNIWTISSVLFAIIVHIVPLQSILGDAASNGIKLFCCIIAAFSIIGAMYIYFIYVLSTRQSTEIERKSGNKMASVASLTPIASSRFLSPKATPGNKPILSPATVSLSNVKTRQSSKSIAVTPPYRSNFDYSNIREETEKVMESIGASEVQVEVPAPEPLPIHAPSLDQRQQFLRQQQDAEKAAASSSFPRYYPSPVTEANAPMTLTEQLINRGRGGIVRTTDALSALNLSDVGAIDDWIENLKSVLGRHLYDVMMRLNQSCQAIVRELTSRNVNSSDVQAIERVLTFQSESEMLSNGDTVNLETICRQINSKYVQDYISTYSIFFVRGEPVRIGRAKPATIERIQRLFQIVSADQDRKLIIEYQAGASTLSHDGSLSSYTDQAPHDSDIAMGIFLHLCDAGSESSTRLFTHKFSLEHYVDVVTSIPEPSLPGLSRGIDKVGIVRDDREYRQARGDRGILANIGGHFSSARDEEERPHFNVYVTHDYRKGTSARIQNTTPANHFSSYGTPYQPWPEGAVGIELLSVIDGRQNVFECVIVLLVELVRRHDPSVRDFGRGSTLYRLILDVFRANDWKELGVLLKVPPAPLALTHSTSIGRTTTS